MLTNSTYGLGIPEDKIDKFKFYKVAQYCDGIETKTGKWHGVDGIANGLNSKNLSYVFPTKSSH